MITRYKSKRDGRSYYRFDFRDRTGRRHRVGGFLDRERAEHALSRCRVADHDARHGIGASVLPERPALLSELVEARIRQRQSQGYTRRIEHHNLRRFLRSVPDKIKVVDLAPAHLLKFQEDRLKHVLPQTLFRELTDIYSMLRSAHQLYPALTGWQPPARPTFKVPSGQRTRVITNDEAVRLLAYLRRPREASWGQRQNNSYEPDAAYRARLATADHLHIALHTAARSSEIRLLRWTDFNSHFKTLTRRQTKIGGGPLVVPLSESLDSALRERRERLRAAGVETPWIFPSPRDPSRVLSVFDNRILREACAQLNIKWGRNTDGGLIFHDARHTAVTTILSAGADLATAQAISGHSTKTMLLRYAHATPESKRRAVDALDKLGAVENAETKVKGRGSRR